MTKEEMKELIRKEFSNRPHPNVKDDFDFIWDIHEKYDPFKDHEYKPTTISEHIKTIDLMESYRKDEILNRFNQLPDECRLVFDTDEDGRIFCDVSISKEEDTKMTAFKLYSRLVQWAMMQYYALCKKNYLLEKENEELKKLI